MGITTGKVMMALGHELNCFVDDIGSGLYIFIPKVGDTEGYIVSFNPLNGKISCNRQQDMIEQKINQIVAMMLEEYA